MLDKTKRALWVGVFLIQFYEMPLSAYNIALHALSIPHPASVTEHALQAHRLASP